MNGNTETNETHLDANAGGTERAVVVSGDGGSVGRHRPPLLRNDLAEDGNSNNNNKSSDTATTTDVGTEHDTERQNTVRSEVSDVERPSRDTPDLLFPSAQRGSPEPHAIYENVGRRQRGKKTGTASSSPLSTPSRQLNSKRLLDMADQLSYVLVGLRGRLAELQQSGNEEPPPPQPTATKKGAAGRNRGGGDHSREAHLRDEKNRRRIEQEVAAVERTIQDLITTSSAVSRLLTIRTNVFEETKSTLEHDIAALESEVEHQDGEIQDGFSARVELLQQYWEWRRRWELGDIDVAPTFAEELKRGPRSRSIGIQNCIHIDHMGEQLQWLKGLLQREETLRIQMRRTEMLVHDLEETTDIISAVLACPLCGLYLEEPVACWPCGHTFCLECFDSLLVFPGLYRCYVCGSFGTEGFIHNVLVAETLAKWHFKDAGYANLRGALNRVELHMHHFGRDSIELRIIDLEKQIKERDEAKEE